MKDMDIINLLSGKSNDGISFKEIIIGGEFDSKFIVPIGIDEEKKIRGLNFNDASSVLVAGETGSGKTMFLNVLMNSLMIKNKPDDIKFLLIDFKNIEWNIYNDNPYLLNPVFNNPKDVEDVIDVINKELDKRIIDGSDHELFIFIDELSYMVEDEVNVLNLIDIISKCEKARAHLIASSSLVVKDSFPASILDKFNCVFSLDLASLDDACWMRIDDASFLNVYGDMVAYSRDDEEKLRVQVPYICDEDINEINNYFIRTSK